MKKQYKTKWLLILTLSVFTLSMSTVMAITTYPGYGVKAEIPFSFTAGNTRLPAGNYEIVRSSNVEPSMKVSNEDKDVDVFLIVDNMFETTNSQTPELVFHKIGGMDFLQEVRTENTVYQFEKTPREKQLERDGLKAEIYNIAGVKFQK